MNFKELFDKLPTSSLEDWEIAAAKQLKGKPLDSIDIVMSSGAHNAPYAVGAQGSFKDGGKQGWVPFHSSADNNLSGSSLLSALNGGAQGVELSFSNLLEIKSELSDIRFDFISLKINGLRPEDQRALHELIPKAQLKGVRLLISLENSNRIAEFKEVVEHFGHVTFLLSPKLVVGDQISFSRFYTTLKEVIFELDSLNVLELDSFDIGIELDLSHKYLDNIIYIHAVRLLFANMYASFGVKEPLPRPYLFGQISQKEGEVSHESFLIDATARAVAGISGGLDALAIKPFMDGDENVAARRARNIQNVLMIEGLLGLPLNAVHGASYFELAAKDLVSTIWPDS